MSVESEFSVDQLNYNFGDEIHVISWIYLFIWALLQEASRYLIILLKGIKSNERKLNYTMVSTAAQHVSFFEDADQMGLSNRNCTLSRIIEGIAAVDYLADWDEDYWDQ